MSDIAIKEKLTIKEFIENEMIKYNESFSDIIKSTISSKTKLNFKYTEKDLYLKLKPFYIWTTNRVYFLIEHRNYYGQFMLKIFSISRKPCNENPEEITNKIFYLNNE